MARRAKPLSVRFVETIKVAGRHADGDNLYLVVSPSGAKSWVFLYVLAGRQREMGLGAARDVSLSQARQLAAQHRRLLAAGIDPLEERARAKAPAGRTFGEVAEQLIANHEKGWKNEAHRRQWRQTLEDYAANLWEMPIADITTTHVLKSLLPIWHDKPETASRLRGRIERVLAMGKSLNLRSGPNPAMWKDNIDAVLPRIEKLQRGHHPAMPYAQIPAFYAELSERSAPAAMALRIVILTAARTGMVRGMVRTEIDLSRALWTVPKTRMKMGAEFVIPLPDEALQILVAVMRANSEALVFPGQNSGKQMSDMVFNALLRRMGRHEATAHGFRSSFRDWVHAETGHDGDVAEEALAHKIGDATEQAYLRGTALAKRRRLMSDWAGYVCSDIAKPKVVSLPARRQRTA